ncbi:hypothetical protein GGI07_005338 [Coemansia sp. Benny D115]|nr:hypothetical protein GGI07_005338 [Coemansia sp. Benny D115]
MIENSDKNADRAEVSAESHNDECDKLVELHGAGEVQSPAILSPALSEKTQASEGSGAATTTTTTTTYPNNYSNSNSNNSIDSPPKQRSEEPEKPQPQEEPRRQVTLKQLYGMLCWLQVKGNRGFWLERPLDACRRATAECQHLIDADAVGLAATMDELNVARLQMIAEHGGAERVPQDTRMFAGGPLFVLFNHAVVGGSEADEANAQVVANATGLKARQQQQTPLADGGSSRPPNNMPIHSTLPAPTVATAAAMAAAGPAAAPPHAAGGPVRGRAGSGATAVETHPFLQRARQLTRAEIRQMRDELAIRREIGMRDALLLADWTALRRRELELRERQIREAVRDARDGTAESIVRFEEFMRKLHSEL